MQFLLSLLLLSATLLSIENIKVSGDAKVYYGSYGQNTKDTIQVDMFNVNASYIDTGVHLVFLADLSTNVSTGVSLTAVSTLGLDNKLGNIEGVWSGAHDTSTGQIEDAAWMDELWFEATSANTQVKVGRQTLTTPLIATETWGTSANTFEAIVLLNKDIAGTLVRAMYIGRSNGVGDDNTSNSAINSVNGKFNTFVNSGAYVVGLKNNSYTPLALQVWYYDIQKFAKAYWLQADFVEDGLLFGAQYASINSEEVGIKNDIFYAFMTGYEFDEILTFKAAYSKVADEGNLGVANIATRGSSSGALSSLYTEMWWWYQTVSLTGAQSLCVSVDASVADDYELFLGYWYSDIDPKGINNQHTVSEYAFTVSKSFRPFDITTAFIYDDFTQENIFVAGDTQAVSTFIMMAVYNF